MAVAFEPPPRWVEEIEGDIARAIDSFRRGRFEEPRDLYALWLEEYHVAVEELIELTVDLTQLGEAGGGGGARGQRRLRALAAPPARSSPTPISP